jgi:hypothetical protein
VVDELWDDLINKGENVVYRFTLLYTRLVLSANLSSKASKVFMTPANKIQLGALKAVGEAVRLVVV